MNLVYLEEVKFKSLALTYDDMVYVHAYVQ